MYGKLGHGNELGFNVPKRVEGLKNIRQVACGSRHTICLSTENKVYAWGEKRCGVTGLGPSQRSGLQLTPEQIPSMYLSSSSSFTQPSASSTSNQSHGSQRYMQIQAVSNSTSSSPPSVTSYQGAVLRAGMEVDSSSTTLPENQFEVKKLVACGFHSALLTKSGDIFTWGEGRFGRLGRGGDNDDHFPKLIPRSSFNGEPVKDISCGGFHSAAITESGVLYIWGGGEHGQLGFGARDNLYTPKALNSPLFLQSIEQDFSELSASLSSLRSGQDNQSLGSGGFESHREPFPSAAVSGSSIAGQFMELVSDTDVQVKALQVVCGWSHTTCLVKVFRKIQSTSATGLLQAGARSGFGPNRSRASQLTDMNLVFSWGNGDHGKLGHGTRITEDTPKMVINLFNKDIVKLASYNEHTVALSDPNLHLKKKAQNAVKSTLLTDLNTLRLDQDFADVVFEVEGKEIMAHKCFLSSRSKHFKAMFENKYNFKESSQNRIVIDNRASYRVGPKVSYEVFKGMIDYMYTDSITWDQDEHQASTQQSHCEDEITAEEEEEDTPLPSFKTQSTKPSSHKFLIDLFGTADMYGLDHLKHLCEEQIEEDLSVDNAAIFVRLNSLLCLYFLS